MIRDHTVIVSGLPRSGTSLMMQMLQAGGLSVLADGIREADDDNPRGYLELEQVKQTRADASWLDDARGKAVKVISYHLQDLPDDRSYRVIFMRRRLDEVLASQRKMLARRGEPTPDDDDSMKRRFASHVEEVERWLRESDHVSSLFISYNRLVAEPAPEIGRLLDFLGDWMEREAMLEAVDPSLYRHRG